MIINKVYKGTTEFTKGYKGNILIFQAHTPLVYNYTGTSSEKNITYNGVTYKLLTLTTNGTLTFSKSVSVDIWVCGGGSDGVAFDGVSYVNFATPGGAGAFCAEKDNQNVTTLNVVIGPANTASGTVITGDASLTAYGVNNTEGGGTGGGGAYQNPSNTTSGSGDDKSKYPFGDTTNFYMHCAGGGGGCCYFNGKWHNGGDGGSNGGGGFAVHGKSNTLYPTSGGNCGGGAGANNDNGTDATFYGSGGGGGAYNKNGIEKSPGHGYQGVCYIRIPISEFA